MPRHAPRRTLLPPPPWTMPECPPPNQRCANHDEPRGDEQVGVSSKEMRRLFAGLSCCRPCRCHAPCDEASSRGARWRPWTSVGESVRLAHACGETLEPGVSARRSAPTLIRFPERVTHILGLAGDRGQGLRTTIDRILICHAARRPRSPVPMSLCWSITLATLRRLAHHAQPVARFDQPPRAICCDRFGADPQLGGNAFRGGTARNSLPPQGKPVAQEFGTEVAPESIDHRGGQSWSQLLRTVHRVETRKTVFRK